VLIHVYIYICISVYCLYIVYKYLGMTPSGTTVVLLLLYIYFFLSSLYFLVLFFCCACIDQQIKTMGIIQNISYDKSRYCSISLDDPYFKHIYCETNTDNVGSKDTYIYIFFYLPCISLFYSFVCSGHLCIFPYIHVPYGAFFINKEFEFEFVIMANHMISLITSSTTTQLVYI
jgi:hypothetical protein